jgi:proteasome beta subunit
VATIVALDCLDGVLLAGDRLVVEGETVVGTRRHVFDFDGVGAAAVGDDPDSFRRRLDAAIREYAVERGEPGVEAVSRMAVDIADEASVEAIVAASDVAGRATARSVDRGVLEERVAARGSAASLVLGQLEAVGEVDVAAAESEVRRAFRAAAARDAGTGEEIDVWRLADEAGGAG